MELTELKAAWNEMNARLERTENLVVDLKRSAKLNQTRSTLRIFKRLPLMELLSGIVFAILFGSWLAAGPWYLSYTGSLVILFLLNLAGIICAAWQLGKLSRADYSGPVVALQKTLAQIRAVRAFMVKWGLILAFLIWVPASVVIAQACFHFDIIAKAGWGYMAANLGLGLLAIFFCIWFQKRFGARLVQGPGVRRMLDDMTGRSLAVAIRSLNDVVAFGE